MSNLSWLNPTPHAIAVYASQPPSPVTTQHSLPSGRYSLLGPDLHRLDRTSFAWRTHSITSSARPSRERGSARTMSGQAAAAPQGSMMKSRRFMAPPRVADILTHPLQGLSTSCRTPALHP